MSDATARQPYPGLRSFAREEADLFFGRKGAVDELIHRLAPARFLAVLGPSGSGKSSLVRAGLLEALDTGLLQGAGARWRVADVRPGAHPLSNLAEALVRAGAGDESPDEEETEALRRFLRQGPRALVEWCKAGNLPQRTNLLVLVDQLESLFSFSGEGAHVEAQAFVAALLAGAAAPLEEARVYVVLTMRSEFLGAAAMIDGLAEAIDKCHFLTPRMSQSQLRWAITGPASVCGFNVEPALVEKLLDDLVAFVPWEEDDTGHPLYRLARRADRLPLMQHVLSLMWTTAAERSAGQRPVLALADYEDLGGLRGALATHGQDILEEILPEHRHVVPLVFRALTAGSSPVEAVSRPTLFGELVEMAHGEELAVREVVEAFRAPGRNFLTPPRPEPLNAGTLIDIGHESLIRHWDEVPSWLRQENAAVAAWRRLADLAERHRRGEAELLTGGALASLGEWWDAERPTARWALRHGGDFDQVRAYLEESRAAEAAAAEAAAEAERRRGRNRLLAFAAVVAVCIVTPLAFFAGYSAIRANEEAAQARLAAAVAVEARATAAADRLRAEAEQQIAEAERARAEEERVRAEEERERAAAAEQHAEEARREALTAQAEAETAAERATRQTELAGRERTRASAAIERAETAETERARAEEERLRAVAAQQAAEHSSRLAESERVLAEGERAQALAARQAALARASAAETARADAVARAGAAEMAREDAVARASAADAARARAEEAQSLALAARQEAEAAAQRAEALADQERLRALAAIDQARAAEADMRRAREELARALAAAEAAEAERDQAVLERRRAVAAQRQVPEQATETDLPLAE